ncbi:ubiquitin carrier protein [Thecamonas trahens ATCC 50062]|uniref:Ubiquitin carrier protein n=1 Tax=Thecamonas trahens ATCC 50062 TaxID=461836 RepID=A0A0L0DCR7_THETB|nr:ubiquitin carrier protein [Thecamonas trahens ATCC 50062]KNC50114.1 ubiquitin carrier protein [Thecamonas trahens ATCC 50062]|eukprot:XP_013757273.1 ubiquitin carrier protein [Thecamonas trahens ATCC 50062]
MAAGTLERAVQRLAANYEEVLAASELHYISAAPLESDMLVWHGNVVAADGPYAGIVLHLVLSFSTDFPASPPRINLATYVLHPNVVDDYVCADFLRLSDKAYSGWSSGYSVFTILMQLQSFLTDGVRIAVADKSSDDVGPSGGTVSFAVSKSQLRRMREEAAAHTCLSCGHAPGAPHPPIPALGGNLAASAGSDLAQRLLSSDLHRLRLNSRCFFSKATYRDAVLGYGVSVEYYSKASRRRGRRRSPIKRIHTELDILSWAAFSADGVRTTPVTKRAFSHFMPMYINSDHGGRAYDIVRTSMARMCKPRPEHIPAFQPPMALDVLPALMDTTVVSVMSSDEVMSWRRLEGYCIFHRWMIYFAAEYPELSEAASKLIAAFKLKPESRTKAVVPSLGYFIPLLTITDHAFDDIREEYVGESLVRNVFWAVSKYPQLAYADDHDARGEPFDRLALTFDANAVSLRHLCFHVYFSKTFASSVDRAATARDYDALLGRPPEGAREALRLECERIRAIPDFESLFAHIGFPLSRNEIHDWLLLALHESLDRDYHRSESDTGTSSGFATAPYEFDASVNGSSSTDGDFYSCE